MCGIVGFTGTTRAAPTVLKALSKLEYRGYDSAGVATVHDGRISLSKDAGKLADVIDRQELYLLPGTTGIGHVRWATHGAATARNAHPHFDCRQRIAIVHNGIIENHRELRRRLSGRHRFLSETDTEVIVHLLEEYTGEGMTLEQAMRRTALDLKGSYAILAVSADAPDEIVAIRKDSPLVAGLASSGSFIASDALSFLDETRSVLYVEDGECVVARGGEIRLLDGDGNPVNRRFQLADWEWGDATKQGHDFFMLKEILEQPLTIRRALMQPRSTMEAMASEIRRARQVIFTACGTSRHAALVGRYAMSRIAGKFSDVVMASEFEYFADSVDEGTLVIAISQSGETADVMEGVRQAKKKGARVISLVNVVGSTLTRVGDYTAYLNCGPEIGVAATKTFMAQLTILYLLAYTMADRYDEGLEKLRVVSELIETNLLHNGAEVPKIAERTADKTDFYYIARGINFAIAAEGALKLKEIAYAHAEGMPAGELKHGTLALIEEGVPVVAICPEDYTYNEILSNIAETKARGALVIGVSNRPEPMFDEWIRIPEVEEILYPLVTVIPLQLLAYHSAVVRQRDPDKPRNLAKSVTVK